MSVIKSRAFLIKSIRYSDSSRILTLFTEESGKVAVIHKGIRKGAKSGASGGFGLMEAVYYFKETREVQTVSSLSFLEIYRNIEKDLERLKCLYSAMELLNRCHVSLSPGRDVFEETLSFMRKLNDCSSTPELVLLRFIVRYSLAQGLMPESTSTDYETFFRTSGFHLHRSDYELLKLVSGIEYDNISTDSDETKNSLSKLCKMCELKLLEHSLGSSFQKARRVFDQI